MNKRTLRIISKIGLLVVMIGFFMPVACNLNGFELAKYTTSFNQYDNGIHILTVGLYGIFIFSCLGVLLLLLIAFGIKFSIKWDWVSIIGTITSAVIVFVNLNGGKDNWGGNIFQSGAYVMLIGMIASLVFMLLGYSVQKNKIIKTPINTNQSAIGNTKVFCSQCGNKINPDYIFCSKCGAKI